MKNPNHPKKGSTITVDPIRKVKDLKNILGSLEDKPRDQLLFTMGIQTGLRCGDLLKLKAGDIKDLRLNDSLQIIESKTGKKNTLVINKAIEKALAYYLFSAKPKDSDYLFRSRKGDNKPLTIQAVNALVKRHTKTLRGNFGAHSLRKTWGYHQRVHFGVGFEVICKRYNHTSPSVTMRYLGIEDSEVKNICLHEIGVES